MKTPCVGDKILPKLCGVVKSMKALKGIIAVLIILLVGGYYVSHHIYDEKYDDYYDKVVAENIQTAARNESLKLKVHITTTQTEYHHLGEDITKSFTCNNKKIRDGDIIRYSKSLDFTASITEHDSDDDVGTAKITMRLPPYNNKATTIVRVDEVGGRKYADAYAVWKVTFEVEPIIEGLEVGFWEVVFS